MFEQAVLRPAPVRGWAVILGFTGELLAVACVLAAPLIWPQLLPRKEVLTSIFAPTPPLAAAKEANIPHVRPTRLWRPDGATYYQPVTVPRTTAILDEPPPGAVVEGGTRSADSGGPLTGLLDSVIRMATPQRAAEPAPAPVVKPVAPAAPQQIRVTSSLQAARLVSRVDPVYPVAARQARISGTVELAGVIGTDGRIRELRVIGGHPFLARAALEAVRQWIYRPTVLGGEPVEVLTTITVVFRLN